MQYTKLVLFALLNIIINCSAFAQDTIVFKDKQTLVVIVKEVSQTEIQYKKLELPDGPMYITNKNDIEKIIYKNGYVEVIKKTAEPVTNSDQGFSVYAVTVDINNEKITYADTKRRHNSLVSLVNRHPDPKRRDVLMKDVISMKYLKRHQNGTRTGAIIFGGFAIAGAALYSVVSSYTYAGYVDPVYSVTPMVFGGLAVALGATAITMNIKLRQKRKDFVRLYNE